MPGPFKGGFHLGREEMNDLRSQRGFSSLFILICNVSSGRFYCELHSEELELDNGAEPSSEVGHGQKRSDPTLVRPCNPLLMEEFVFEKPADPNTLSFSQYGV